ncbi:hypothetical protein ACFLV0_03655 [Chloroflexota bacterium]
MPIKWCALRVNEAMDMVEEFVNQAVEPLEQAKIVASEARNIANLPQYIDQRLVRLVIDIERMDYIRTSISAVRNDLPNVAVEAEKKSESHGWQPALVSYHRQCLQGYVCPKSGKERWSSRHCLNSRII